MAATPPRPASPALRPLVVPKAGHPLQISPNLEALLEHDELTRRNSSEPASPYHTTATSPEFAISLPPPPPRTAKGGLKTGQREQGPFFTTRSKEVQRRRIGSDFWPDALPMTFSPDGAVGTSSRPVTPNPYLNPAPTLEPFTSGVPRLTACADTPCVDQAEQSSRSELGRAGTPERPSKLENLPWMGLHQLSGSANGSDRRNDHAECGDVDAVQGTPISSLRELNAVALDRQMRQLPVPPPTQATAVSTASSGDNDTATVLSPRSRTLDPHQAPHTEASETASTHSYSIDSESGSVDERTTPTPRLPAAHRLPCLSLPSISLPHNSSPRLPSVDSLTGRDYLSFIDLLSPPMSDELDSCNVQVNSRQVSSSRPKPRSISISPCSLYSTPRHNLSSTSLASMRFAPPSPTSFPPHQLSPTSAHSDVSSSSVALSSMMFAPPSPSVGHVPPTRLQPLSEPSSPYSPLEFAPPSSPPQEVIDTHSLLSAPEFAPERGRRLKPNKRSVSLSPNPVHHHSLSPLPPTTNQLGANERADRIRRNRKLARVFGRMPGAEEQVADPDEPVRVSKKLLSPSLAALLMKQRNHRHSVSVSVSLKAPRMKTEPSTLAQTDNLWSSGGRRHSIPLAARSLRLYVDEEVRTAAKRPSSSHDHMDSLEAASTRSFIDLSDEDICDDDLSAFNCLAPHLERQRSLHQSSSTPSLVESLDSKAHAEVERRRKREKLARLHRFLGSRVPPEAVNGSVFGCPPPPLAVREESNRGQWLHGNMSAPPDEFDRGKEELDEREKALIVRRAQKMERVFGTPPPQVLFHTRPSRQTVPLSQPTSPVDHNPYVLTLDIPPCPRNPNQSAYMGKTIHRQGPSDSSRCLLPHKEDTPQSSPSSFAQSFGDQVPETLPGFQEVLARCSVYLNYQHSLNSLVDMIDRDDRKSLVELHRFLHEEVERSPSEVDVQMNPRRASNAASFKSDRRYSLPSNASVTSLSSEFHACPKASEFQIRRRKAAKLTNFFGVDYRELIHDILESIEKGVEEECQQGTLQPQEVEVLMHRVRSLRTLRAPSPC